MTVRGSVAAPRRLTGISACRRRRIRGARWRGSLSLSEDFPGLCTLIDLPLDYVKHRIEFQQAGFYDTGLGHHVEFHQDLDRMHIPHQRAKDILLH